MKPREFWIVKSYLGMRVHEHKISWDALSVGDERIHVREVVAIDWGKVWEKYEYFGDWERVQQIVENALKGEL